MNIGALIAIEKEEVKVNKKMGLLNKELRKKGQYYNFFNAAKILFPIKKTIESIELRIDELDKINKRIPQLFNWQKKNKTRKLKMYRNYLESLKKDVLDDEYFSNNGNLLKTIFEIISELEEVEKEIDVTYDNLTFLKSIPNLFK
jgi:long-subunit acyl-CoA synthetase (AMP-forming)